MRMAAYATIGLVLSTPAADAQERTIFSCQARDRRIEVISDGRALAYRSYRRGGLELQIPGGVMSRTAFSGGGELQTAFRNGPWTYVVYQRTVRTRFDGPNEPAYGAGVDVLRGKRTVSRLPCGDPRTQFVFDTYPDAAQDTFVEH